MNLTQEQEPKTRIVTPEQYEKGYLAFLRWPKAYTLIKKLPDGNYLVKEPTE